MNSKKTKAILTSNQMIIVYIMVVLSILIGTKNAAFFDFSTVITLCRVALVTLIFALGEMLVIVSGGIDVSFPAIACLTLYLPVFLETKVWKIDNVALIFILAVVLGLTIGAFNAWMISIMGIPPLIATLGTSSIINGALMATTSGKEISNLPASMDAIYSSYFFTYTAPSGMTYSLSVLFAVPVILIILTALLLRKTMLGRGIFAIGGDKNAAKVAGFNVRKIQFFVYMLAGAMTGIAGVCSCILARTAHPTNLMGSEMMVIAAVVVGGTRITGGHGTVIGTVLGVFLIALIQNNLIMMGVPTYWQAFVVGLVIVLGTSITSLRAKKIAQSAKV